MSPQQIMFHMRVPAEVKNEDGIFVSSCCPLDVHSQGNSEAEALENLTEALRLFVETCFEMGTLEVVLKDCGFAPGHSIDISKEDESHTVEVPLPLLVAQHAQARAC